MSDYSAAWKEDPNEILLRVNTANMEARRADRPKNNRRLQIDCLRLKITNPKAGELTDDSVTGSEKESDCSPMFVHQIEWARNDDLTGVQITASSRLRANM